MPGAISGLTRINVLAPTPHPEMVRGQDVAAESPGRLSADVTSRPRPSPYFVDAASLAAYLRHSAGDRAGDAARAAGQAASHTIGFTHTAIGISLRALAAQIQKMPARTAFAAGAVRDFAAPRLRALPGSIASRLKNPGTEPAALAQVEDEIISDANRAAAAASLHIGMRRPSPELLHIARVRDMTPHDMRPDPDLTAHFAFSTHGTTAQPTTQQLTNTILAQHFGSALNFQHVHTAAPSTPNSDIDAEHIRHLENITEETESDLAGSREHLPPAEMTDAAATHNAREAATAHEMPDSATPTASVHSTQPDPEEWELINKSAPTTPKAE